ncbi:type III pantothenate kinase [Mycoplasma sp. Sp33II]|uniref:type III pantothenate kinase n=1 Tax=unclassified Mycoplasma TaxID=2683645 RepID=UPI003AAB041A
MQKNEHNYLVFDIGNSMIKFHYINSQFQVLLNLNWLCNSNESIDLENILALCMPSFQDQIIIASSNNEMLHQEQLVSQLQKLGFCNIAILDHTYGTNLKLANNIQHNEVGIDILACLQYCVDNKIKDAYVFMFGTALVALKIEDNTLLGASIAPGAFLSYVHIQEKVAQLSLPYIGSEQLGTNTQEALNSGLYNLLNGFILSHIEKETNLEKYQLLLTGGDGAYLKTKYNYLPNMLALGYLGLFLSGKK